MSAQPNPNPSRSGLVFLCCLWLAGAASAQDDPTGPLAEARALAFAGRPEQAVPLYQRLAAEIEQQEGRDAWSLVFPLYELAVQHHILGALGEAESLYRRSLAIAESHRGARDPALVPGLRGLATIAATRGVLEDAEELFRRALEIQVADTGDPSGIAQTLSELGLISQIRGRVEQAEGYYRRALQVGDASLEDTDVAIISGNLGALYDQQGRYAEAEAHFRKALEIRQRSLAPDHPDLAGMLEKLGSLQYRQRRFVEAASSYERSLKILEDGGQDDLAVAEILGRLAATYRQLRRSAVAEVHFGTAGAILEAQCGGREYSDPCRDAIRSHRALRDEPLVAPPDRVPPVDRAPPVESAPAPVTATAAAPVPPPAPPPASPESPPATSQATISPGPPESSAPESSAPESPAPESPAPESPDGPTYRAQVGAREDPREAAEILTGLQDSNPDLLGGLPARIVTADLGERGVWHRVQIGDFTGLSEAKELCDELVRRGHEGCWVVPTED